MTDNIPTTNTGKADIPPTLPSRPSLCFVAAPSQQAIAAQTKLIDLYGNEPFAKADVIVALGGDGMMLRTLHQILDQNEPLDPAKISDSDQSDKRNFERATPIYGMNLGSVGFLMNDYSEDLLIERITQAEKTLIHPLLMLATDDNGKRHAAYAINEVSLIRNSHNTANLKLIIDDKTRVTELISDGILVSTQAGSTAYNLSAHGPILPIGSSLMALTPISPFRPRRWKGAIIPNNVAIKIVVNHPNTRPVNATADFFEINNVVEVKVKEATTKRLYLMFDPNNTLAEKVLHEQFLY